MNDNNLRKRRPHGQDAAPSESSLPSYPSSFSPVISSGGFAQLPPELQQHLAQVASFYGLTPQRLHEAAWLQSQARERTPKRPRLMSNDPMSPEYNTSPSSSSHQGPGSGYLLGGISNLKGMICQHCLKLCDSDGYQAIPEPSGLSYGPSRSYTAEKPSAVTVSGTYVPTTMAAGPTSSFVCAENTLVPPYMGNYQQTQSSHQPMAMQPTSREAMVYPAVAPGPAYFGTHGQTPSRDMPIVQGPRHSSFATDHVIPTGPMTGPYGTEMSVAMTGSHPIGQQGPMEALPPGQYGLLHGFIAGAVDDGVSQSVMQHHAAASGLDVVFPNQKRPPARRGPFQDPLSREQTAQTRRIGSCIRCRMQRIRCKINPDDENGPCETCMKLANKTTRLPCIRRKITEVKLFKPGQVQGFEWTRRWKDSIVDNIAKWASAEDRVIRVSEGYTTRFVELRVRAFVPQDGDKLERTWVYNGVKKSAPIPPYAIVDLDAAQASYTDYINRGIAECIDSIFGNKDGLLAKTYQLAWHRAQNQDVSEDERALLLLTLRLWMAVRLTTRSTFIVGDETLGMARDIMDRTSPNHGCIPLPPVMGAQLDLILIHHIQAKLRRDMLDRLQRMTQSNKQKTWLTTYLVTFILLHNIALLTQHDAGYARKHGIKRRFAREKDVEEYHLGANVLLAYFHYCNKGIYPFSRECREQELRALAELDDARIQFVRETRDYATDHKNDWERVRESTIYEDDYFFVSQLFEENWQPPVGL